MPKMVRCQVRYSIVPPHALPVTELAVHLPNCGAFYTAAGAAAWRKISADRGDAAVVPLTGKSFFENSLSLHICGLQFFLCFSRLSVTD